MLLRRVGLYAAMNRIRLFVREDPSLITQTAVNSGMSSTWIVTEDEGRSSFDIEEVRCKTKHKLISCLNC